MNMKRFTRALIALLASIFVIPGIAACSNNNNEEEWEALKATHISELEKRGFDDPVYLGTFKSADGDHFDHPDEGARYGVNANGCRITIAITYDNNRIIGDIAWVIRQRDPNEAFNKEDVLHGDDEIQLEYFRKHPVSPKDEHNYDLSGCIDKESPNSSAQSNE